jgi:hypothetical protein
MNPLENKKYIQKVCGVVYRQFIKKENIDIYQMADDRPIYEYNLSDITMMKLIFFMLVHM